MTKEELRILYKAKRKELSEKDLLSKSIGILSNLKKMDIWKQEAYHIFLSIPGQNEINSYPIIDYLFQNKKKVVVPKVENENMINCLIDPGTEFVAGKFNVPEPKEFKIVDSKVIDVIFLPMLICDQKGNRIGYGGGYYDRFLVNCKKDAVKIGLNFFSPVSEIKGLFDSDVPIDYCITDEKIYSFCE